PRPAACFPAVPWPAERLAGIDQVAAPGDAVILDARPAERFRGAPDPWDPRAGHIPGARSLPCRENLDPTGRFLPVAALRQRFADVGVGAMTSVISSCGSGVTACHTLLALELVDGAPGRLYPGSWSEWSRDPDRPVATGIQ
ncbi:MAG TPA: rhodanese-like domain-containing protein, partial [Mycobacteriales bacterium]|nr:rhodanese-like domain-containing protein [Mycobacteriales bacterium]